MLLVWLLLMGYTTRSQEYTFQQFSQQHGLNDPFIYALTQDDRGFLLVGTGEGLGIFDGVSFRMKFVADSLSEDFISVLHRGKSGHIWIGHKEGGISYLHNGVISPYQKQNSVESLITGIASSIEGKIWIASQNDGLLLVDWLNGLETSFKDQFTDKIVNGIETGEQDEILVATDNGLLEYRLIEHVGLMKQNTFLEGMNISNVRSMGRNKFVVSTISEGVFILKLGTDEVKSIPLPEDIVIKDIYVDDEGNIYVCTINEGLIKYTPDEDKVSVYNTGNGMETDAINTVFVDREETVWIGSYGKGVYKHAHEIFTYYLKSNQEYTEVRDVFVRGKEKFFALENYVVRVKGDRFNKADTIFFPNKALISSIWVDAFGDVWVGTTSEGVMKYHRESGSIQRFNLSSDLLSRSISDITGNGKTIWFGTLNGLYKFDIKKGKLNKFDISKGLAHNSVNCLLIDPKKDILYVGNKSTQLSVLKNNQIKNYSYFDNNRVLSIYDMELMKDGSVAIASHGDGILFFRDSSFHKLTTQNGLSSNFCYGIQEGKEGVVWVTHNGTLSKLHIKEKDTTFRSYGESDGVNFSFLKGAIGGEKGSVWFGTQQGLLRFDETTNAINLAPPVVGIHEFRINGDISPVSSTLELSPGTYDFVFEIRGVSLKNPKSVQMKYKLEGYDTEWSDVSTTSSIKFSKISDGTYSLKIVAYNDDLVGSDELEYIRIVIRRPIWKKWWFWLIVAGAIALGIYWLLKYRERRYLERQEELEKELQIRTREVREQKEKLEDINKDITDSINYAKRIQDAMSPDMGFFRENFPESFVLYKPRDIVSGDFFWTNRNGNKRMIVCGDCTGHGVPGAFIALISQQLLRETFGIKRIHQPDEILHELDDEIKFLVNSTDAQFHTPEGMDVVVCEFDMENMKLRWASAMRPLVWYRNGERQYQGGTRSSVGSALDTTVYELHEMDIQKGDVFYMFSDGYPDQFGGVKNKKLKISGLLKILDEAQAESMDKQQQLLDDRLLEWQGEQNQTDDIILIGVKI